MSKRVVTGILLGTGALLLIWFGGVPLSLACVLCLCFALSEEYKALTVAGHRPVAWPTWTAMILGVPVMVAFGRSTFVAILLLTFLVILMCVVFRKQPSLTDALMSLLPMFSVVLPSLCMIYVTFIENQAVQRVMMLLMIAVPVIGDTAAYYVGTFVKGPKLCPEVSPNKTMSGAIAGLIASLLTAGLIGLVSHLVVRPETRLLLPEWYTYVILGLMGGIAGQMGDLFASLIKRHCGLKDFSDLFPGHGGMLDRLDSILFMAYVIFCYRILL